MLALGPNHSATELFLTLILKGHLLHLSLIMAILMLATVSTFDTEVSVFETYK